MNEKSNSRPPVQRPSEEGDLKKGLEKAEIALRKEPGIGNYSNKEVFITNGYSKLYAPTTSETFELDPENKESSHRLMDCIL